MQQCLSTTPNKKARLNPESLVDNQSSHADHHDNDGGQADLRPATQIVNDDREPTQPATQIVTDDHHVVKARMPATQIIIDDEDGAKGMWPATQIINDDPEGITTNSTFIASLLNNDAPQGSTLNSSASSSAVKEFDLLDLVMAFDASPPQSTAAALLPVETQPRNYLTDEEIWQRVLRGRSDETRDADAERELLLQESKSSNVDTALAAMQRLLEMDDAAAGPISRPSSSFEIQQNKGVHWTSLKRGLARSSDEQIVSVLHAEIVRHAFYAYVLSYMTTVVHGFAYHLIKNTPTDLPQFSKPKT